MTYLESANHVMSLSAWEVVIRLVCAMVIGAVVGTEREYSKHPAGMRTHTLVCLGACTVMITGQLLFQTYSPLGASPDPARLGAQVIAGVGFLGAGSIIRDGTSIRGLTTAAGIWVVACLGLAVGAGFYFLALTGMGAVVVTLLVFEWLQKKLICRKHPMWSIAAVTTDISKAIENLREAEKQFRMKAEDLQVENVEGNRFRLSFYAEFTGRKWEDNLHGFLTSLNEKQELSISSVKEMEPK